MRAKARTATDLASSGEVYLAPAYYEISEEDGIPVATETPLRAESRFLVVPPSGAVRAHYVSKRARAALEALEGRNYTKLFKLLTSPWFYTMLIVANFVIILTKFSQGGSAVDPMTITIHTIAGFLGLAGLMHVKILRRFVNRSISDLLALGAVPVTRALWENIENLDEESYPDPHALYGAIKLAHKGDEQASALYRRIEKILSTDSKKDKD